MRALHRINFAEGELLRSHDLQAALDAIELRRLLHVRGAHRAAGVALGFAVGLGRSRKGIVVGPGFGYDRCGREIVSARTVFIPSPTIDGTYVLAVAPGCRPVWRWLEPPRVRDELILARFESVDGNLGDPDVGVRPGARGSGGRLAAGLQKARLGATMRVNTSEAGFGRTPYYFVTLAEIVRARFGVGPFVEVVNASRTHFDLVVRTAHTPAQGPMKLGAPLTVHWVGVEMPLLCGDFEPDTAAVARPGDPANEYATFKHVPPTTGSDPD